MDIIFDIDGTVANLDHRLGYVRTKPKNWAAFDAAIPHDSVIAPVRDVYDMLAYWPGGSTEPKNRIIFASGRSDRTRAETEAWLFSNGFKQFEKLYMRSDGDTRKDFIIKAELLEQMRADGYDPKICFDDRLSVAREWPKLGVFCFCVNQGFQEF